MRNSKNGDTLLHKAIKLEEEETMKFLVEKGIDLNLMNVKGLNVSHISFHYNFEIFKYLVEKKADLNIPDNTRNTFLHIACKKGKPDVVEFLLKNGADPNAKEHVNKKKN